MRRPPDPGEHSGALAGGVEPRVCLGVIVGAHGVRGQVRVRPFTATPDSIGAYGPACSEDGARTFDLRVVGAAASGGMMIARVTGVDDRDAAEALKGVRLYVPRSRLPPADVNEFYHADLIGLRAETVAGRALGTVRAVNDFGAGDVIEIEPDSGPAVVVPFTGDVVPVVDIAGGRLVIDPPAGLLDADRAP